MTATTSVAPAVDPAVRAPRRRLLGGVVVAVVGAVVVAVVVGWLVWPTPPGPVVLHAGTSHYVVTATVDSARIGGTAVEIDLSTRARVPVDHATVEIDAVMPLMGHAAPPAPAESAGGGRYRAAQVPLMMTGPWELHVSIDGPAGADNLMLPLAVTG
ncbi:FixH family protein [Actinophytocola sp.]|jgi:hypothetical protein|uniref:FixH family protein n=1 Tax=Actinophytocola sp. TaxID=1872138 RepID=UPI002ED810E6